MLRCHQSHFFLAHFYEHMLHNHKLLDVILWCLSRSILLCKICPSWWGKTVEFQAVNLPRSWMAGESVSETEKERDWESMGCVRDIVLWLRVRGRRERELNRDRECAGETEGVQWRVCRHRVVESAPNPRGGFRQRPVVLVLLNRVLSFWDSIVL